MGWPNTTEKTKASSPQLVQKRKSPPSRSTRNSWMIFFHKCGIQKSYSGLLGAVSRRKRSQTVLLLPAVAIPFVIILRRDHVANPTSINSLGEGILQPHCLRCLPLAVLTPLESPHPSSPCPCLVHLLVRQRCHCELLLLRQIIWNLDANPDLFHVLIDSWQFWYLV